MKDNETRLVTTAVIWIAFTIVMVAALIVSDRYSPFFLLMMAFMFTLAALAGTQFIWKSSRGSLIQIENSEKIKRRSRVERMLDSMDEADLDELRSRLDANGEGEAVSLDELMTERERQRR